MKYSAADITGIGMTSQRTRNRMVNRLAEQGIKDRRVLKTMGLIPRHLFVDEALSSRVYEDVSLPIGHGQTISQPYIVARMTELLLEVNDVSKVLEVGSGSGYQAAVLADLVSEVYTVERIRSLLQKARDRFRALEYRNIHSQYSDGQWGLPDKGPFDAIILTAAPETVPDSLKEQLRIGGKLIVPLGSQSGDQFLTVITRREERYDIEKLNIVRFVPFLDGKI